EVTRGLIGEFIRRETEWDPQLRLIKARSVDRKLEGARHDADDGVGFAVELDCGTQDARIAMKAALPKRVADDGDRLMSFVLLAGEDAAQIGVNAKGVEYTGREARGWNGFGSFATGEFVSCPLVAPHGTESCGGGGIDAEFARADRSADPGTDVVAEDNEPLRVGERERTQQNSFDEGEDCGGSPDAECQSDDDDQREARGLPQLPEGESDVTQELAHWFSD